MKRLLFAFIVIVANLLLVLAGDSEEFISDPLISAAAIELKRITRPAASGASQSYSATRNQAVPKDYDRDILDTFDSIAKQSVVPSDSANGILAEGKKSPLKKSRQSSSKSSTGYGYPFNLAPPLPPFSKFASDRQDDESEPEFISSSEENEPTLPSMRKISAEDSDEEFLPKQADTLKKRQGSDYDGDSKESREFSPPSFDYSSYREPNYRNSYDLEDYSPRRMYYESRGPYSRPSFSFPTPKPRPKVSPRDPYLSPSDEPIDGFYPKVKNHGVSNSYSTYDKRNKYYNTISSPDAPPSRGYYLNDDFSDFSSEEEGFNLGQGGYAKNPKYESGPGPYSEPDPYDGPPPPPAPSSPPTGSSGPGRTTYDSFYNSPIIGITRKRLLDYAGASDLYQGEPDYLKSAAIRKTKFSSIEHDYSPYRRSDVYSFTDYHFDESRTIPSRVKREVIQQEDVPNCAKNTSLTLCLTDDDYPTLIPDESLSRQFFHNRDEIKKLVSKNIKFLSQLKNTRLEINQKKPVDGVPESVDDLKKTQSVCSSKKGSVYPKRAKDVNGIWRIVVNVEDAQQNTEIDVCRSAECPCDYVPAAILTKCIQQSALVTFVTFNAKDNILEHHEFPVPSACGCSVGWPLRVRLE